MRHAEEPLKMARLRADCPESTHPSHFISGWPARFSLLRVYWREADDSSLEQVGTLRIRGLHAPLSWKLFAVFKLECDLGLTPIQNQPVILHIGRQQLRGFNHVADIAFRTA